MLKVCLGEHEHVMLELKEHIRQQEKSMLAGAQAAHEGPQMQH